MCEPFPLPFETADFLFAPKKLPDPETDLDTFLEQCNKEINQMLCRAWKQGALPKRTALVQVLTKPPVAGQVDFRHPFILKKSLKLEAGPDEELVRLKLIASFAHTTWHLMHRKASSHARMRELGDTSRGAMVIFTKDMPPEAWPSGLWHILHLGYAPAAWTRPLDFSDCNDELKRPEFYSGYDLGEYAGKFETFDVVQFLQYAQKHKHKFSSIINDAPAPSDWCGYPSIAKNADEHKKPAVADKLFDDIVRDKAYRDRVAALLHCGAIVLCAPQSFFMEGHLEKGVIFDSGLTVIFSDDKAPNEVELAQINVVAHSISLFIASTYGLANKLAHESQMIASRNIVSMISHSLGGTLTKASSDNNQLERKVRLEMIKLDAASILFDPSVAGKKFILWDKGGFESESLDQTIQEALELSEVVNLSTSVLNGKLVDARFAAILIELCQNLIRHSETGQVVVFPNNSEKDGLDISISGKATCSKALQMVDRLQSNNVLAKGQSLRGWHFILMLCHALSRKHSHCLEINFDTPDKQSAIIIKGHHDDRQIKTVVDRQMSELPPMLNMQIKLTSLAATK